MRSHNLNLPVKLQEEEIPIQLSEEETESASSSSSSEEEDDEKGQFYGLREKPKRSIRLVDPEFSFPPADPGASSIVLQDRESETESSRNPTKRRSKRGWKSQNDIQVQSQEQDTKSKNKKFKLSKSESWPEPEPVSSISDATTEEDVAFCLMMLSRDKWKKQEEEAEETEEETDESDSKNLKNRNKGKYKCETCNRVFKSYQALGGHRASHKKFKSSSTSSALLELEPANVGTSEKKIHKCPVCFRVFASGQALGGHKRSHATGLVATTTAPSRITTSMKFGDHNNFIDLNLPAVEDDDYSQIELSAVSDAEFVNQIRR